MTGQLQIIIPNPGVLQDLENTIRPANSSTENLIITINQL